MSPRGGQLSIAEIALEWLQARFPVKTAECVAAQTGVAPGTVRKWFQRSSAPSAPALVRMIEALPPDFLESLMEQPPKWVRAAVKSCEREELEQEMARLSKRLSALAGDDNAAGDAGSFAVGEVGVSRARVHAPSGGKTGSRPGRHLRGRR